MDSTTGDGLGAARSDFIDLFVEHFDVVTVWSLHCCHIREVLVSRGGVCLLFVCVVFFLKESVS